MINFDRMMKGVNYKDWKMKIIISHNGDYVLGAVNCKDLLKKDVVWLGIDEQTSRKLWIENRQNIMEKIVAKGAESGA